MDAFSPPKMHPTTHSSQSKGNSRDNSSGRSDLFRVSQLHKHTLYNARDKDISDYQPHNVTIDPQTRIDIQAGKKQQSHSNNNLFKTKLFKAKNAVYNYNTGQQTRSQLFAHDPSSKQNKIKGVNASLKHLHKQGERMMKE
jgi:hypothetical protein